MGNAMYHKDPNGEWRRVRNIKRITENGTERIRSLKYCEGPSEYQHWSNYVDSPVPTKEYQYQLIYRINTEVFLLTSIAPMYYNDDVLITQSSIFKLFRSENQAWIKVDENILNSLKRVIIEQSNNDIYSASELNTIVFKKTTLDLVRVNF